MTETVSFQRPFGQSNTKEFCLGPEAGFCWTPMHTLLCLSMLSEMCNIAFVEKGYLYNNDLYYNITYILYYI